MSDGTVDTIEEKNAPGHVKVQTLLVCRGTGCVAGGSDEIYYALKREAERFIFG